MGFPHSDLDQVGCSYQSPPPAFYVRTTCKLAGPQGVFEYLGEQNQDK